MIHAPKPTAGSFVVSALADAKTLLSSPAVGPWDGSNALQVPGHSASAALIARGVALRALWMWGEDRERHARVRKIAASALAPRAIGGLLDKSATLARELLTLAREDQTMELVDDFVAPLIRQPFLAHFGVCGAQAVMLHGHFAMMAPFVRSVAAVSNEPAPYFALAAAAQMIDKLWEGPLPREAVGARVMIDAVNAGALTRDEAISHAILLMFGNETSVQALAGLIARLIERADLWHAVALGALVVEKLVEEGIRLGPPSNMTLVRTTIAPVDCAGMTLTAGTEIRMPLGALNRDPCAFVDPDTFDPDRDASKHIAFGGGPSLCVGAHLARTTLCIAIRALVTAYPASPEARIVRDTIRTHEQGVVAIHVDSA